MQTRRRRSTRLSHSKSALSVNSQPSKPKSRHKLQRKPQRSRIPQPSDNLFLSDDDEYEASRLKNIRANAEMLASLGLEQAADLSEKRVQAMSQSTRIPQDKEQRPQKQLRATAHKSSQRANTRSLRSTRSRRPVVVEESDDGDEQDVGSSPSFPASDVEHDPFAQSPDDAQEEDYESLRLKNIQANAALLASLGLMDASSNSTQRGFDLEQDGKAPLSPAMRAPAKRRAPQRSPSSSGEVEGMLSAGPSAATPTRRSKRRRVASKRFFDEDVGSSSRARMRDESPTWSESELEDADFVLDDFSDDEEYFSRNVYSRLSHNQRNSLSNGSHSVARLSMHTPLRRALRLGARRYDPKQFGSIPGVQVGDWWSTRMACSTASVHAPTVAGISGNSQQGCWSLCVSGGYEDDVDSGDTLIFTGSGGRALKGTASQPKNLRTAPQSFDQSFEHQKNAALVTSSQTRRPIRLVRGFKGKRPFAPPEGYVYGGLYSVESCWMERGFSGFQVCKFRLMRLPGQPELPTFEYEEHLPEATPSATKTPTSSRATSSPSPTASTSTAATSPSSSESSAVRLVQQHSARPIQPGGAKMSDRRDQFKTTHVDLDIAQWDWYVDMTGS